MDKELDVTHPNPVGLGSQIGETPIALGDHAPLALLDPRKLRLGVGVAGTRLAGKPGTSRGQFRGPIVVASRHELQTGRQLVVEPLAVRLCDAATNLVSRERFGFGHQPAGEGGDRDPARRG